MTTVVDPNQLPDLPNGDSNWREPRPLLAMIIIIAVFVGILALALAILFLSTDKSANFEQMLTMLLPLFGSWVGTVLAFYFTRENFESATKSYRQLVSALTPEEKLKSSLAVDHMLKRFHFEVFDETILLSKILENLDNAPGQHNYPAAKKFYRIPILDESNRPKHLLHRSTINAFTWHNLVAGMSSEEVQNLTLGDLLNDPNFKNRFATTFVTLGDRATMADVKARMSQFESVQDAYITANGQPDSVVYGWITNINDRECIESLDEFTNEKSTTDLNLSIIINQADLMNHCIEPLNCIMKPVYLTLKY